MPKYTPGNGPLGNDKHQVAGKKPDNGYDRSTLVPSQSFCKTPNYVIIGTVTNNVGFFFGSSASFASKATAEGPDTNQLSASTNYVSFGKPAAGTTLDIHPTAWSGSAADDNSVIFIYKSGLSTGGR